MAKSTFAIICFFFSVIGYAQGADHLKPIWSQRLDACDFATNIRVRTEGIAAINPHEIAVYCVTQARSPLPSLTKRNGRPEPYPYRLMVLFLDTTDGHVIQRASWPTLVNTQAAIFPINDELFLLSAGSYIEVIDRKTLSPKRRLDLPPPGGGCERWNVIASHNGKSFAVYDVCDTGEDYTSEITTYETLNFEETASWKSSGRNFYDIYDGEVSRWSTSIEYGHDIFLRLGKKPEMDLRATTFTVSESFFVNSNTIFCCRNSTWLRLIGTDGHELASINLDPNHPLYNPKVLADQLFVSKNGQRVAALVFHVPWSGPVHWECDVFDRNLRRLMAIKIPRYHRDLTAGLSPDDKYIFLLRDDDIDAYAIPQITVNGDIQGNK